MGQKRAQLQLDAKPLPLRGTVSKWRGFGLWTPHRQGDLALEFGHHQLAAALGNGEKGACSLTMTAPDPFDKRRVRRSVVIRDYHASVSDRMSEANASATILPGWNRPMNASAAARRVTVPRSGRRKTWAPYSPMSLTAQA
jgi:hypothetical protein